MERQTSSSPVESSDAVAETLERLEVADTLEQLRHHIDDLIRRLSQQGEADAVPAHVADTPELESQIEHLGEKVESASDLLSELTDLLEAQTERIETIEQQLGDPDLGVYGARRASAHGPLDARAAIPTFSMRAPMALPEPPGFGTPDAGDILREYLDARLEGIEDCIAALEARLVRLGDAAAARDRRLADLCDAGDERDRHIVELHEAAVARDRRIAELTEAGAQPDGRIDELVRKTAELEEHVAHLDRAAAERDRQIAEMTRSAAERDRRMDEMGRAAAERDRLVHDLEERLLILVDADVERETTVSMSPPEELGASNADAPPYEPRGDVTSLGATLSPQDGAPQTTAEPHGGRRAHSATNSDSARAFAANAPRPVAMPLFAHRSAPLERPVLRAQSKVVRATRDPRATRVEHGARSSQEDEEGGADHVLSPARPPAPRPSVDGDDERVPAPPASRRLLAFDDGGEPEPPPRNGVAARLLGRESPGVRNRKAATSVAAEAAPVPKPDAPSCLRSSEQEAGNVTSRLPDFEDLVERDVRLARRLATTNGKRAAKTRPNILVVDDSPDALTVLSIFLSKTGYQVVTATSAEDGLAKLRHHQIDAVVLDAKMPGAGGGHVCRALREDPAYAARRHVPVIVYTGYPDDFPDTVRGEWRADDYVVKGGDMLPLITALVRHTTAADA